jgi:hypothetical protein
MKGEQMNRQQRRANEKYSRRADVMSEQLRNQYQKMLDKEREKDREKLEKSNIEMSTDSWYWFFATLGEVLHDDYHRNREDIYKLFERFEKRVEENNAAGKSREQVITESQELMGIELRLK